MLTKFRHYGTIKYDLLCIVCFPHNLSSSGVLNLNKHPFFFRFNWLPVVEDVDESPYVYGYLCDLIEGNHPIILGQNNANIPRILAIFAEAFAVEALPVANEEYKRMVLITRQVQVNHML